MSEGIEVSQMDYSYNLRSIADDRDGNDLRPCQQHQYGFLCFLLGFFFSVMGILIAAIVEKGYGATQAIWGIVWRWIISVLVVGALFALLVLRN